MAATKIVDNVYYVGVQDPDLVVFDIIMPTQHGTTYNSYLVKGTEKTALIDTVKEPFTEQFFANIEQVVPIDAIDYLIVNHNEPDHSGAARTLLERNPKIKIYCGAASMPYVRNILNIDADITGLKDAQQLELGGKTLTFRLMPYMHWPDTAMNFLEQDRILFSNDGFAAHICTDRLYADELTGGVDLAHEFWYYFDSIMRPFTGYIRRNLTKLDSHDIDIIAPSHGPLYRQQPRQWIDKYRDWSVDKSEGHRIVSVFYASNYGNTEKLAQQISRRLVDAGYEAPLVDITQTGEQRLKEQLEKSLATLVGTPTFNGDAVKPVWDFVALYSMVYAVGKKAAVFGSYGWAGEGIKMVADRLGALKQKMFTETFGARLVPSTEEKQNLDTWTSKLIEFIG